MKISEHKKIYKQICDYMGEDLNAPVCKEVAEHLANCPHCKVYLDTVKKTITLCKEMEKDEKLPDEVKNRLYRVLNIGHQSSR
jgi:predicted anti-sigma-YlaC factor YlaD